MLEKLNKPSRLIIGVALAVIIWIVGIMIGQEQTVTILNPEGGLKGFITRNNIVRVSLMLDYGNGQVRVYDEVPVIYGDSVLNLLAKAEELNAEKIKVDYVLTQNELGDFSIDGYKNTTGGKKWLVWVNNNLQIDDYQNTQLKARDIVELKYINLQP